MSEKTCSYSHCDNLIIQEIFTCPYHCQQPDLEEDKIIYCSALCSFNDKEHKNDCEAYLYVCVYHIFYSLFHICVDVLKYLVPPR